MFKRSGHKYGAVRTEVDGFKFQSRKEANRYQELKLLEKMGKIQNLELQPRYPIDIHGVHVCTYVGDFLYLDREEGTLVLEDTKGIKTPVYQLKKKLVRAVYGQDILET